ncbi:MAG: DUF4019 domain-containing protein [Lentisphaerae bacterium]|nr:DUF4019 domain-containing protein [Lentisphaerota bacterium]
MLSAGCVKKNPEAEKAAVGAAREWLELVDDGLYVESWQDSAAFFRAVVTSGQWVRAMDGTRRPLGGTASRQVRGSRYRTTMPGAPDGEYVIIRFDTAFANKKKSVETVTPMLENGTWRVSGYYIR